ncbi:MAG: type II secretion system minor pseudopilin GspK [Deltaproteobacteria bacterium]|nr:type II secretion system minor pseudopilin GspK [Deltaproteobacteria bacterium]
MKAPDKGQRGIALIVVLLVVSILVALTVQLNYGTRSDLYEAANFSDGIRLTYIAKSGFNFGVVRLLDDETVQDTLTDAWADSSAISDESKELFSDGGFEVSVEDESGKIPINRLVQGTAVNQFIRDMLIRLLKEPPFSLGPEQAEAVVNAMKDWMDTDSDVTGAGAENDHYRSLPISYDAKNGPLDSLDELLMIKGVTEQMYYGTEESPGLRHLLTLYGDGKININTAPRQILRVLAPEITDEMAEHMDAVRREPGRDLSNPQWYRQVSGMGAVGINSLFITTSSDYFRITATGYFGRMRERVSGVVKRDLPKKTVKLIGWKVQ